MKRVIELNYTTPHRQKPYRRSEMIYKFISVEVDHLSAYPLHKMRSILSQSHQAKTISTLDMSRKYTVFAVEGK